MQALYTPSTHKAHICSDPKTVWSPSGELPHAKGGPQTECAGRRLVDSTQHLEVQHRACFPGPLRGMLRYLDGQRQSGRVSFVGFPAEDVA